MLTTTKTKITTIKTTTTTTTITVTTKTATTTTKTTCLNACDLPQVKLAFLERDSFERLLGPCLDVMKRNSKGYKKASLN